MIFIIHWCRRDKGRCLGNLTSWVASLLVNVALVPASSARSSVCVWKARTLSCKEPPQSYVPVSEKAFHAPLLALTSYQCTFHAVWKQRDLVVEFVSAHVVTSISKSCFVSVHSFVISPWESRPVIMRSNLQAFLSFFLALKV